MSSVQIVLRKKQSKDNTYPLAVRITKDRKSTFIYIGQYIKETEWDDAKRSVRKSHPNSARINNFLLKKLSEANDKLLQLETDGKVAVSSKAVKKELSPTAAKTFFTQAAIYLDNLKKSRKYNMVTSETPRIKHFREFLKGEDISFQDITIILLKRFQAYLKGTRKVSDRTITNHLLVIRTIFNQAIKSGIATEKSYPFGKNKIPIKFPDSIKLGLTSDEVASLETLDLPLGSQLNHARNIWLFAFYFAGMRVSDVLRLKWTDFQDQRLHYAMGKNAKTGSLKISEKATRILAQYKREQVKHDLVFPELEVLDDLNDAYEVQRKISYAVKKLDKYLKKVAATAEIEKKLTMHIARHTFGNISGDKISIQMLQKLYRHSSITTTIGYQANFIHRDADDALDSVIGS